MLAIAQTSQVYVKVYIKYWVVATVTNAEHCGVRDVVVAAAGREPVDDIPVELVPAYRRRHDLDPSSARAGRRSPPDRTPANGPRCRICVGSERDHARRRRWGGWWRSQS